MIFQRWPLLRGNGGIVHELCLCLISDCKATLQQLKWRMKGRLLGKQDQDDEISHRCRDGEKTV